MKKHICQIMILLTALFYGCERAELEGPAEGEHTIVAKITSDDTKTQLGEYSDGLYKTVWSEGDEIAIYPDGALTKSVYTLSAGAGTSKGTFTGTGGLNECHAFYPAVNARKIETYDNGASKELFFFVPRVQKYVAGTFSPESFPMVATGSDGQVQFRNIFSILKISMTGSHKVDSIVFDTKGDILAGNFKVSLDDDDFGEIGISSIQDCKSSIVLDCGGVQLSDIAATDFYIAVVPGKCDSGFNLSIYTPAGVRQKTTLNDIEMLPSHIRSVKPFRLTLEGDPDYEEDMVVADKNSYGAPCVGGVVNVSIERNVPYTVEIDADWISLLETKDLQSEIISFNVEPNETSMSRDGRISLYYGGNRELVYIYQGVFEEAYLECGSSTVNLPAEGGSVDVVYSANRDDISIVPDGDWFTVTEIKSEVVRRDPYLLQKTYTFSAAANAGDADRTATVTASVEGITVETEVVQYSDAEKCFELVYVVNEPGEIDLVNKGGDVAFDRESGAYFTRIDYGDGTIDEAPQYLTSHFYESEGDYTVKVYYKGRPTGFQSYKGDASEKIFGSAPSGLGEYSYIPVIKMQFPATFTDFDYFKAEQPYLYEITFLGNVPDEPVLLTCTNLQKINSSYSSEDGRMLVKDGVLVAFASARLDKDEYVLPEGIHTISDKIFYNSTMKKIVLPSTLTTIGKEAFFGSSLESLEIPSSVRSIGEYAFGVTNIESVDITSSDVALGYRVFSSCDYLKDVKINSNVSSGAFYECEALESVELGADVTEIADNAFEGCSALTEIDLDNLVRIGAEAFSSTGLTSVYLPGTLTSLGESAFSFCYSLEEVRFAPDIQLTSIMGYTFAYCSSLKGITIPKSVRNIFEMAFNDCTSLETLEFEPGSQLNSIADGYKYTQGYYGVFERSAIKTVILPEGLNAIPVGLFSACTKLESVVIPSTVKAIGDGAFYKCALTSISLPDGLEEIGANAFAGQKFASVTIPDAVKTIGSYAFTVLEELKIGSGLQNCSETAFDHTSTLKSIESKSPYVVVTEDKTGLVNKEGSFMLFASALGLTEYEVPETVGGVTVTRIGALSFSASSVETIHLPATTLSLGMKCLQTPSLNSIYLKALTPPKKEYTSNSVTDGGFSMIGNETPPFGSVTVYVPEEAVTAYEEAEWAVTGYDFTM